MPKLSESPLFDTIFFDNGDYYEGEAVDRVPNGQGTMYYESGATRFGFWRDGVPITRNAPDLAIPGVNDPNYSNSFSINTYRINVGYGYEADFIAEIFEVSKYISGIRLHHNTAVLFSLNDSIYRDGLGWQEDFDGEKVFYYTGEGLTGNQVMKKGNYFLANSFNKNVFLFVKRKPNDYVFHGKVEVKRIEDAREPDKNGVERSVFKFVLRRRAVE